MLKETRLLMRYFPIQPERVDEERLCDPMTSQDVDSAIATLRSEHNTGALAHDETLHFKPT
jgi:hypothetical protein